jgi:peptidoglycan/LPS O-acetylase OafA/YrhL
MENIILIVIMVLGLLVLLRHFNSIRKGEPISDEFSKRILQKASSLSFYVSLYFWLLISYFSDKINFETGQLINYGIIGMAIIVSLIWAILKTIGLKND